jgi:polar amino acid transport system permease protein
MLTIVSDNAAVLVDGVVMTLIVSSCALLAGCPLALLLAYASLSRHRSPRLLSGLYRSFWRGTPILIQLLIVFYLPPAIGIDLPPALAAIVALAFNTAAFQSEIYRAGLSAIPAGQIEAASLLGLSRLSILWRIEAPQAIRLTLPALVSEVLSLVKNSSLVSVIAVTEITRRAQQIASSTFRPLEAYATALCLYLAIAFVIAGAGLLIERRFALSGERR